MTDPHDLIVSHYSWPFGRICGRTLRTKVDEAKRPRWSSLVYGIEPKFCAVLTNAFDFSKFKAASTEWRDGNRPIFQTQYLGKSKLLKGQTQKAGSDSPDTRISTSELSLHFIGIVSIVANHNCLYLRRVEALFELNGLAGQSDDLGNLAYVQSLPYNLTPQKTSRASNNYLHACFDSLTQIVICSCVSHSCVSVMKWVGVRKPDIPKPAATSLSFRRQQ